MIDALEQMEQHQRESADHELHEIKVPEWGLSVWFKSSSAMTGAVYQKFSQHLFKMPDYEAMVDILILRARNQDGLKMFTSPDKKRLMGNVSHDLITDVVSQMTAIDNTVREVEKKD